MALSEEVRGNTEDYSTWHPAPKGNAEATKPSLESLLLTEPTDPARNLLTREERVKLFYAHELAEGNLNSLSPRFQTSDYDPQNPQADLLVADPLADPDVSRLATLIQTAKNKQNTD
jgi:hypothetical protein